ERPDDARGVGHRQLEGGGAGLAGPEAQDDEAEIGVGRDTEPPVDAARVVEPTPLPPRQLPLSHGVMLTRRFTSRPGWRAPVRDCAPVDRSRVETFSDGIFAIAITLLVLTIAQPDNYHRLGGSLVDVWPSFAAYIVSFAIIGIMWLNHHTVFGVL